MKRYRCVHCTISGRKTKKKCNSCWWLTLIALISSIFLFLLNAYNAWEGTGKCCRLNAWERKVFRGFLGISIAKMKIGCQWNDFQLFCKGRIRWFSSFFSWLQLYSWTGFDIFDEAYDSEILIFADRKCTKWETGRVEGLNWIEQMNKSEENMVFCYFHINIKCIFNWFCHSIPIHSIQSIVRLLSFSAHSMKCRANGQRQVEQSASCHANDRPLNSSYVLPDFQ